MNIIVDNREQLALFKDERHRTIYLKLDEGDYNIPELVNHIVIERKTMQDLYGTLTKGHERFKQEILRSRIKQKKFYIFVEGTEERFFRMEWSKRYLKCRPHILKKIIATMEEKYSLIIIWCEGPRDAEENILRCFELNKQALEIDWEEKYMKADERLTKMMELWVHYNLDYGTIQIKETPRHLIIEFYNGGWSENEEVDMELRQICPPTIDHHPMTIYVFHKVLLNPEIVKKVSEISIKIKTYKYNFKLEG